MKHLKKIHNAQNRRSGELNAVKSHGCHIHCTAEDMAMATMCPFPSQHHGMSHWKCVLICCKRCPILSITRLEINKDATSMCSKIRFYVYINVSHCTIHGQIPQE